MEVRLIDHTGIGTNDQYYAARLLIYAKNTRLEQGEQTRNMIRKWPVEKLEDELYEIANTIRSSWEFVDFTFEVRDVTRAYTHQQVRTRVGVSFAQQAMRVADMSDFGYETPKAIKDDPLALREWVRVMEEIKLGYGALRLRGIAAQDARGLLPTNIHTNILVKMNLRTLADLVGKRENLRAQGEYSDVVRLMTKEALIAMPWIYRFLYPERLSTPNLDKLLKDALGERSPVDAPELNRALKELDRLKATWG
jgi:flavin-dependent thymidylate synthase